MTAEPTLYVFAISHYCEKARWALDYFGIPYRLKHTMPGLNRRIAKKLGTDSGSLPFLHLGDNVVAGSAAIIDWGELHRSPAIGSLNGKNTAEVTAIEKRLDDVTGIHIRRFYYSDALLTNPASVRPIFSRDLPLMQKAAVTLGWSRLGACRIRAHRSRTNPDTARRGIQLNFQVTRAVASGSRRIPAAQDFHPHNAQAASRV